MKTVLLTLVVGIFSFPVVAQISKAKLQEATEWKAKTLTLEKVLNQNGWWKPKKEYPLQASLVLENQKQTEPAAMLLRSRDVASTKDFSLKDSAHKQCLLLRAQAKGEMVFKFDEKTESGNCWVIHPLNKKTNVQKHTFLKIRSILKGSKAFTVESALLSTDIPLKAKGPSPIAVKIAQAIGAK